MLTIATVAQAADDPNMVSIVCDNLGYGEVGSHGGGVPRGAAALRIDSLAQEGMRGVSWTQTWRLRAARA